MKEESEQNAGEEILSPEEGYALAVERLVEEGCHIKDIGESVKLSKSDVILEDNTGQSMDIEINVSKGRVLVKIELETTIEDSTTFAFSKLLQTQKDYGHLGHLLRRFENTVRLTQMKIVGKVQKK